MIGNDVVDLAAAAIESDWRRKGFLNKVFSAEEQEIIATARNQHQMVWLLWSMKEAAYKAHQREFSLPRRVNWRDCECFLNEISDAGASGIVTIWKSSYSTASELTEAYIHTSAVKEKIRNLKIAVFETSSEEMKRRLFQQISEDLKLTKHHLKVTKNEHGVPKISFRNTYIIDLVSFSDHGKFAAYSLSLMNCEMAVKHY